MNLLIGVKSCVKHTQEGYNESIRQTWGKDVINADLRFFMGRDPNYLGLLNDEVMLDCSDDYEGLPHKVWAMIDWTLTQDYNYIFLCDTDSFIRPDRLLTCGFEKADYYGIFFGRVGEWRSGTFYGVYLAKCYNYALGWGYFLSRKAMKIVTAGIPLTTGEDLSVAQILIPAWERGEIRIEPAFYENLVVWHFPKSIGSYHPDSGWMEHMYGIKKLRPISSTLQVLPVSPFSVRPALRFKIPKEKQ